MSSFRTRRNNRPAPTARRTRFRFDTLEARDVPATLSGLVWNDLNNDGTRDPNETSLTNVQVKLIGTETGTNNTVQRTATTDADGIYRFTGLNQGTYAVHVGQVPNYTPSRTSAGVFGGTPLTGTVYGIPVPGGSAAWGGYNFGLVKYSPPDPTAPGNSLSGLVWHDLNNDGVRDPNEPARANVEVMLTGTAPGNPSTLVNRTATTDANGLYRFAGLERGDYSVRVGQVPGLKAGKASAGAFGGTLTNDKVTDIALPGGWQVSGGYNFGLVALDVPTVPQSPPGNTLGGHVWDDLDNDGRRDPNEKALANVWVWLDGWETKSNGDQIKLVTLTVQTDANGLYRFTGLRHGTYRVHTGSGAGATGYVPGKVSAGAFGGTLIDGRGVEQIALPGGWPVSGGYNLALIKYVPPPLPPGYGFSGHVWLDADNDGVRDPNEAPLANVRMGLVGLKFSDNSVVGGTVLTDANGFYQFTNLPNGYYSVQVGQTAGYQAGKVSAGAFGGSLSGGGVSQIYLTGPLREAGGYNFGLVETGTPTAPPTDNGLSGLVWRDQNRNGVQDPNEALLANAVVRVFGREAGTNNPVDVQVTTDANGEYRFTGLKQGTYALVVALPPDYSHALSSTGVLGGRPLGNNVQDIALPGDGREADGYNFAMLPT